MPPAKRTSSAAPKSSSGPSKPSAAKTAAAGRKATATSARKGAARTATQAKAGAKATATVAQRSAKPTKSRANAAQTSTKRASGGDGVLVTTAKSAAKPRDTVTLTREKIQETLDDAAARGRVTRKDANDLVAELIRRGWAAADDAREESAGIIDKGRTRLKKVRKAEPVDRIVRGADRARRAAHVGPAFPIIGYDDLNVSQVQARIKTLSKPDQREVLSYERGHANRKTVVGALEKTLA